MSPEQPPAAPVMDHRKRALLQFRARWGAEATHLIYAPGRVNLIGEHTDYNGGYVLPFAIDLGLYVAARPRADRQVRIWTAEAGSEPAELDLSEPLVPGETNWSRYIRGVLAGLLAEGLALPGFDAIVHASLPAGGGLSSSAALEVSMATLGEILAGRTLDPRRKALLCQKAEHVFAGTPCGIMDQFSVIFGEPAHLLLIDCQTLEFERVAMPGTDAALLVINTMVRHELTDGGYASRRKDCFAAAGVLGLTELGKTPSARIEAARAELPERLYLRARHVATENERTLAATAALRRGAWSEVGALMYASHESLRDDFNVSCEELDLVVESARNLGEARGVFGCRMTGGGFGGCCVALVETARAGEIAAHLSASYRQAVGLEPTLFITRPAAGVTVLQQP